MPPKSKQGAAGGSARRAYADALRASQETIGARVATRLAGQWPREVVGFDLATGLVADECVRLVTTLAFAVELDAPDLFAEQITWLQRLLDARGFDAARIVAQVIDAYRSACLGPAMPDGADGLLAAVLDAAADEVAASGRPAAPAAGATAAPEPAG